jgi:hypothetical protein
VSAGVRQRFLRVERSRCVSLPKEKRLAAIGLHIDRMVRWVDGDLTDILAANRMKRRQDEAHRCIANCPTDDGVQVPFESVTIPDALGGLVIRIQPQHGLRIVDADKEVATFPV